MTRRKFFATAALAPFLMRSFAGAAPVVVITDFAPSGRALGTRPMAKVERSDAEWQAMLSPLAFQVTRHQGTERAFTGPGWDNRGDGIYRCICCGTALFDSRTKFDSGTGWPSFWRPIASTNVSEKRDTSLFEARTAVSCALCDAHLGHVFGDGPRPTGLRYCMNAVALRFVPRA